VPALAALPPVVHAIHKPGVVGAAAAASGCGGTRSCGQAAARRPEGDEDAGEQDEEPADTDDRLTEHDAGHEDRYAEDRHEDAGDESRVVDPATAATADGRDEVRVVLIETALHLIEESLFLL
jgi:hypothetical protein